MANILLKLTGACCTSPPVYQGCTYTPTACDPIIYTITNICTLAYNLCSPVQVIPIPETQVNLTGSSAVNCEGCGPIIIKVEGNTATVDITWTISCCENCISGACLPACISSAEEQLDFLLNTFQNRSLNYTYTYSGSGLCGVGALLTKISATLTSQSPVVYTGNITMVLGDNITVDEG